MDKMVLDFLYRTGRIPDRIYYQVNGKSPQENYVDFKTKLLERFENPEDEIEEFFYE